MMELPAFLSALGVRLSVDAVKTLMSRAFGSSPAPERVQALAAFDEASAAFFEAHGDRLGAPSSSFLASAANWERVLDSTSPARPILDAANLNLDGFDGAPAAIAAEAEAFVVAFHDAVARKPALAPALAARLSARSAEANWTLLQTRLGTLVSESTDGPALSGLDDHDRARWMEYLRAVADRYGTTRPSVPLDAVVGSKEGSDLKTSPIRTPLADAVSHHSTLLVVAPPGAGKTRAARELVAARALALAAGRLGTDGSRVEGVPVLVNPGPGTLFERIAGALHAGGIGGRMPTSGWVRRALAAGALWVVVDDAHRLDDPRELADLAAYSPPSCLLALGRDVPDLIALRLPRAAIAPLSYSQQIAVLHAHLPPSDDDSGPLHILHRLGPSGAVRERPLTLALVALAATEGQGDLSDRRLTFERAFRALVASEPGRTDALSDPTVRTRLLGAVALHTLSDLALGYQFDPLHARGPLARALADLSNDGVEATVDLALSVLGESHALTRVADGRFSFAHDQWHEYFAATELLRTRTPLTSIASRDARREVALFVATAPRPVAEPAMGFWWSFWRDLVVNDLAAAADVARAVRPRLSLRSDDVPPLTLAEREAAYAGFLDAYSGAVRRHFPRLRGALPPHHEGVIGLRVWEANRSFPALSLVALKEGSGATPVRIVSAPPSERSEPGVHTPTNQFGISGMPSRFEAPAHVALRHVLQELDDLWKDREFWEPDALLIERAFYEGASLAAALDPADGPLASIDVAELLERLGDNPTTVSEIPRKGALGLWGSRLERSLFASRPVLTPEDWRHTLDELKARSQGTSVLHTPVRPPIEILSASVQPYTAAESSALTEWSVDYVRRVYETVYALLHENLPTAAHAVHLYRLFPVVVTLVPDPMPASQGRTTVMGDQWAWPSTDSDPPLVEVRVAEPGSDLVEEANAAGGGWTQRVWRVPAGGCMPLYDAVYSAVDRDIEALTRL